METAVVLDATQMSEGELMALYNDKAISGKIQKTSYPSMWGPNAHEYEGFWVDDSDARCFSCDDEVDLYIKLIHKMRDGIDVG